MSHRIFVGKILPDTVTEADLQEAFSKYGDVTKIDFKGTYAFVFYDELEDCEAAIKHLDGAEINGSNIVVQHARNSREAKDTRGANKPVKRMDLRLTATGIDSRVSWQDLKDWAREAGEVTFTNVFTRDQQQVGVIEFATEDALSNALNTLEDVPLKGLKVHLEKEPESAYRQQRSDNGGRPAGFGNSRGDFGPRGGDYPDRPYRDNAFNDRRPGDQYDSRDRFGGDRGGGYGRGPPPDFRGAGGGGGFDRDRGDFRGGGGGYGGPGGYDHRGPPGGYDHRGPPGGGYPDGRRFSDDFRRGPPGGPPGGFQRGAERSRSRSRERGGGGYPPHAPGYGYEARGGGYNGGYNGGRGGGGYGDDRGHPAGRFYDGPPRGGRGGGGGGYDSRR